MWKCGNVELEQNMSIFKIQKNTNHMKYESAFNVIDGIRNLIDSPFNHAQDFPRLYTLHSTLYTLYPTSF